MDELIQALTQQTIAITELIKAIDTLTMAIDYYMLPDDEEYKGIKTYLDGSKVNAN